MIDSQFSSSKKKIEMRTKSFFLSQSIFQVVIIKLDRSV